MDSVEIDETGEYPQHVLDALTEMGAFGLLVPKESGGHGLNKVEWCKLMEMLASFEGNLHDPARDLTTLNLIPKAIAKGVPVLAICRGFQEMNIALGGTLWQKVQDVPGMRDHREDKEQPLDVQYAPAHEIELVRGGYLHGLAGADRVVVNSLHSQGVQTLGGNLEIEARAPDGLIEAFRVSNAPGFALAVQWHPEWQVLKNPFSHAMFAAFGDAARARINARK